MWVMNQDKEALVNVNDVCFYEVKKDSEIIYQFRCYGYGDDYYILGEYSTKEKAMKVMDMIEEEIIKCEAMITVDSVSFYDRKVVFQLPADSEVE